MKTTKLLWLAAALALPLMLASCEGKDDGSEPTDYAPGEIPGLGEAGGELTGSPFALPAGVTLAEGIAGAAYDQPSYWADDNYRAARLMKPNGETPAIRAARGAAARADGEWSWFGSGPGYVDLAIRLHNDNAAAATVTLPAALIVRSVAGDCQNGVLLKKVTVTVPAGSDRNIVVSFYCGNAERGTAGPSDHYVWGVVSNAAPLLELCEMVKGKKINIEEFDPADDEAHTVYSIQTSILQGAVWSITDRDGLSDWTRAEIEDLPNS